MPSMDNMNDKQNLLLTQLAYSSDVLLDVPRNTTFAEMAKMVTDPTAQGILEELIAAGLGSFRIKDVGNDEDSGFGAIAFEDGNGNVGISYRGTDGMSSSNDMVDNVQAAVTGTSGQTAQAEAFFDKNRDPNGRNYLYGHSKGGNLAESVFVNNEKYIKKIHLLNPQPINPYSLLPDQFIAINSDKVDIVVTEGDYVWFLGVIPSFGNIRIAKGNGSDPHLWGAIRDKFDENGNIQEGSMPAWELPVALISTTLFAGVQAFGGAMGLLYNCTVRIVDFVMNDLLPAAKEFIDTIAKEIQKLGAEFKEFVTELKAFLESVVDRAVEWFNSVFNEGYKYASANPEIIIDTYKLRSYAASLQSINSRIANLDGRMDGLYWKVGLLDIWNLLQADIFTGYSWRLLRCSNYLYDTADEFERIESSLSNSI